MDLESPENNIKKLMEEAKGITNKILYKVGALGYGLLGEMSFKEFLPGVNQADLDLESLEDLLKNLGCVMNSLDRLQNNYLNSKETNKIREDIRKIKNYPMVTKENKKILDTWLKWRRGAFLRSRRGDCSYKLKY